MTDHFAANQISQNLKALSVRIYDAAVNLRDLQKSSKTTYDIGDSALRKASELAAAAKNEAPFDILRNLAERIKQELDAISEAMRSVMSDEERNELTTIEQCLEMSLSILAAAIPITKESLDTLLGGRLFSTSRERALEAKINSLQIEASQISKNLEKQNVQISESINNVLHSSESAGKKVLDDYAKVTDSLKEQDDLIKDLQRFLSSRVLQGAHSDTALARFESAKVAMTWAYVLIGLTVYILIFSLAQIFYDPVNYPFLIGRFFTVLFLTLPITLLIRDASRFRATGNRYWQTALDLQTLDPYISNLTQEDQAKIKVMLAPQMFFAYESSPNSDGYSIYLQDSITKLTEILSRTKAGS